MAYLAVIPRSLDSLYALLCMRGGLADSIGSADISNEYFHCFIDRNVLRPSIFVDDPDALHILYPGLLRGVGAVNNLAYFESIGSVANVGVIT